MKKLLMLATAVAVVGGPVALAAAPANAGTVNIGSPIGGTVSLTVDDVHYQPGDTSCYEANFVANVNANDDYAYYVWEAVSNYTGPTTEPDERYYSDYYSGQIVDSLTICPNYDSPGNYQGRFKVTFYDYDEQPIRSVTATDPFTVFAADGTGDPVDEEPVEEEPEPVRWSEDYRTTAPTTTTNSTVPRGGTIRVSVNRHGSKVISRTTTLWQNGHRVRDWSPRPGSYQTKSVIRWQPRISEYAEYEDANGEWQYDSRTRLGQARTVTRWNTVRVARDESPGVVTRSEWNAVHQGMSMARVHAIFGTSGTADGSFSYNGNRDVYREYRSAGSFGGELRLNFDNYTQIGSGMRLYSKSRYVY